LPTLLLKEEYGISCASLMNAVASGMNATSLAIGYELGVILIN